MVSATEDQRSTKKNLLSSKKTIRRLSLFHHLHRQLTVKRLRLTNMSKSISKKKCLKTIQIKNQQKFLYSLRSRLTKSLASASQSKLKSSTKIIIIGLEKVICSPFSFKSSASIQMSSKSCFHRTQFSKSKASQSNVLRNQ